MRQDKWIKLEELRAPGTRRIMEAVRMVRGEMSDLDDDDILTMPAGVLMRGRQEGGCRQRE
jgi:hypothetical protein